MNTAGKVVNKFGKFHKINFPKLRRNDWKFKAAKQRPGGTFWK